MLFAFTDICGPEGFRKGWLEVRVSDSNSSAARTSYRHESRDCNYSEGDFGDFLPCMSEG